ncbi:MAG: U32 family peptidase [Clostridia bacterium]|nr:U32 family peptidase [Clostridia bacterium]
MNAIPELLAPAGSPDALDAAIEAGADAVYFGASLFSNRMRAKNFSDDEIVSAVRKCAAYGVASHVTLNIRMRSRELPEAVSLARRLWDAGVTAFIVADAGLAEAIKKEIPEAVLHASTQTTGVNSRDAAALEKLGFSRMVCPRELSKDELFALVEESPIEIEAFVHGALCVSVSGQCLMSWAMGGRSGNRGECAQPCRLPYSKNGKAPTHALSLKDSCLARHIPELIGSGVSSLKIEGRLKAADYVFGVTRVYRRLLDERRAATDAEVRELDSYFSREGFTDGYFTGCRRGMNGMRPEGEAAKSGVFTGLSEKVKISAHAVLKAGEAASLTLSDGAVSVTVTGDTVDAARSAPTDAEAAFRSISKLGASPYALRREDFTFDGSDGFAAVSALNGLRRAAVEALTDEKAKALRRKSVPFALGEAGDGLRSMKSAEFMRRDDVPREAEEYFDAIFLPEREYYLVPTDRRGKYALSMPEWCADGEKSKKIIEKYSDCGGRLVLCHTAGQISDARDAGLCPVASFRLNVTSPEAADVVRRLGAVRVTLSPELPAAAALAIMKNDAALCAVSYGHLPLMLVRKCVIDGEKCSGDCLGKGCPGRAALTDRKGEEIRVLAVGDGVNVLTNPHVIWCADRPEFSRSCHFIFTEETAAEAAHVISADERRLSPEEAGVGGIRRL